MASYIKWHDPNSRSSWNINPVSVGFCMKSEALIYMIVSYFFLIFLLIKVTINCSVILESYYHCDNKIQLCCCKSVVKSCSKCILKSFLSVLLLTIIFLSFFHIFIFWVFLYLTFDFLDSISNTIKVFAFSYHSRDSFLTLNWGFKLFRFVKI